MRPGQQSPAAEFSIAKESGVYGAIPANPQDVRAAPGHQDPDSEPNSPTRRVLAGTLPESGAGGVTPEQGSSPAPERGSDRAEAAELEAAGAECARLAQLHNAAERCKAGSYSDLLELIAPELPWFCLPGPGECSLVLDTETTGLPWRMGEWLNTRYQCLPAYDTCRLVGVAWQVLGPPPGLEVLDRGEAVVRPEGYDIPEDVVGIHGITNEAANQGGIPVGRALAHLMEVMQSCRVLVAHSVGFHVNVVLGELLRLGRLRDIRTVNGMKTVCTMKAAKVLCTCDPHYGIELVDALHHLTGLPMSNLGSKAASDAEGCRLLYSTLLARRDE